MKAGWHVNISGETHCSVRLHKKVSWLTEQSMQLWRTFDSNQCKLRHLREVKAYKEISFWVCSRRTIVDAIWFKAVLSESNGIWCLRKLNMHVSCETSELKIYIVFLEDGIQLRRKSDILSWVSFVNSSRMFHDLWEVDDHEEMLSIFSYDRFFRKRRGDIVYEDNRQLSRGGKPSMQWQRW